MKPEVEWLDSETLWPDDDVQSTWFSDDRSKQWKMVFRATRIYLILIVGLGAIISFLGGDPLAYGWFMPKILFLIVGLALVLALGNSQLQDEGQNLPSLLDFSRSMGRDPK